MDYREHPPSEGLEGLIKTFWSLAAPAQGSEWIEHRAVPDGCVEIIRRLEGRSEWGAEQPARFAVGLIRSPASFRIGRGARFAAIRIWPWAWPFAAQIPLGAMADGWTPAERPDLADLCDLAETPARAEARLLELLGAAAPDLQAAGRAILAAGSIDEVRQATGWSGRSLQRWFERHVGLPPRAFLRILRFQRAFAGAPEAPALADHALAEGFADQAHMSRDFRALAGEPPGRARRSAKGPFLR